MGWGAEQSAFAVTGTLLLLSGAIAGLPSARVRHSLRVGTVAAAAIFIAAAFLSASHGRLAIGPWIWFVALASAIFLGVLAARVVAAWTPAKRVLERVAPGLAAHRRDATDKVSAQTPAHIRLKSAADPSTSGNDLADLAYAHPDVRVAVAANPSTPANVLGWLASIGEDEVTQAIAQRCRRS